MSRTLYFGSVESFCVHQTVPMILRLEVIAKAHGDYMKYYLTILAGMLYSFPQLQDRYNRIVNEDKDFLPRS